MNYIKYSPCIIFILVRSAHKSCECFRFVQNIREDAWLPLRHNIPILLVDNYINILSSNNCLFFSSQDICSSDRYLLLQCLRNANEVPAEGWSGGLITVSYYVTLPSPLLMSSSHNPCHIPHSQDIKYSNTVNCYFSPPRQYENVFTSPGPVSDNY